MQYFSKKLDAFALTGNLFFDKDGIGKSGKFLVADLAAGLSFDQNEIFLTSLG